MLQSRRTVQITKKGDKYLRAILWKPRIKEIRTKIFRWVQDVWALRNRSCSGFCPVLMEMLNEMLVNVFDLLLGIVSGSLSGVPKIPKSSSRLGELKKRKSFRTLRTAWFMSFKVLNNEIWRIISRVPKFKSVSDPCRKTENRTLGIFKKLFRKFPSSRFPVEGNVYDMTKRFREEKPPGVRDFPDGHDPGGKRRPLFRFKKRTHINLNKCAFKKNFLPFLIGFRGGFKP